VCLPSHLCSYRVHLGDCFLTFYLLTLFSVVHSFQIKILFIGSLVFIGSLRQQGELSSARQEFQFQAGTASATPAPCRRFPYVGDAITPQQMDCPEVCVDDTMRRIYLPIQKPRGGRLSAIMFDLKMELVGEAGGGDLSTMLAQAPGSHTETLLVD